LRISPVKPLIARAAFGYRQKADLFVVADGRHFDPSGIAQFSDGEHSLSLHL
jgi:hypothetical protein